MVAQASFQALNAKAPSFTGRVPSLSLRIDPPSQETSLQQHYLDTNSTKLLQGLISTLKLVQANHNNLKIYVRKLETELANVQRDLTSETQRNDQYRGIGLGPFKFWNEFLIKENPSYFSKYLVSKILFERCPNGFPVALCDADGQTFLRIPPRAPSSFHFHETLSYLQRVIADRTDPTRSMEARRFLLQALHKNEESYAFYCDEVKKGQVKFYSSLNLCGAFRLYGQNVLVPRVNFMGTISSVKMISGGKIGVMVLAEDNTPPHYEVASPETLHIILKGPMQPFEKILEMDNHMYSQFL